MAGKVSEALDDRPESKSLSLEAEPLSKNDGFANAIFRRQTGSPGAEEDSALD